MTDVIPAPPLTETAPPPTDEQRRIIEAPDGPVVVIAGAGTGKTRVIVDRVRWLLETHGQRGAAAMGGWVAASPIERHGDPFAGPLVPEQLLVLTYNVKAAAELAERLDAVVGPTTRARMSVSNFHSFCQRVLTESAADAGLPAAPVVLDGPGQLLLLRDLRPQLGLRYHGEFSLTSLIEFINRAKDELVGPDSVAALAEAELVEYERRYGPYADAEARLLAAGNLQALRVVQRSYGAVRASERAEVAGLGSRTFAPDETAKAADREARRTIAGDGTAPHINRFGPEAQGRVHALAATYERDGAALEVLRWREIAAVYAAYQAELARRNALDFGEQIALVVRLFEERPNVLRRWQRHFRYILVDEFQDANIAQIALVEQLGRTPDRPDNVMVVGDDDQSIYRFRGASFAAFSDFVERFSRPPAHAPDALPPGPPPTLRLERNFRSVEHVLTLANRLIACNGGRFDPGKHLWTERDLGTPVELHLCANEADQAVAIVDAIRALAGPAGGPGSARWRDVAVLYRKHKHRDAIVDRLRDENIPYTVVGGLALFETPEIRDLEQAMRAIANPEDDAALVRMLTAGPWRLDALEVLAVTRDAHFDRSHVATAIERLVRTGEAPQPAPVDAASAPDRERTSQTGAPIAPDLRAKLRRVQAVVEELDPLTWREGPATVLERYLELTGTVLDLLSTGTLEARRAVVNIASFLRFSVAWQASNPQRSLADFVDYLDAYKAAGGELPTSVELSEDADRVRLMTLYQAKGLEFPIVVVPDLVDGEWPVKEHGAGIFPRELLRERMPDGDVHLDEERRLLYVAITRAQDRLVLATHDKDGVSRPSSFVEELRADAGDELIVLDRGASVDAGLPAPLAAADPEEDAAAANDRDFAAAFSEARRVMALPSARERRLTLRLRAAEIVGLLEGTAGTDPESAGARGAFTAKLADIGRSAFVGADEARAAGLDPLTFRDLASDPGAGASLLRVAPLPSRFSYSSLDAYERCPLLFAFAYVYRLPQPVRPRAPLTFGSTAHQTFEAFTQERRDRLARGEPAPTREDLERMFRSRWKPQAFGDSETEADYGRKIGQLLDNFWAGEAGTTSEALAEEVDFVLVLDPVDGSAPVRIGGQIDRIDRLASGGIEVIDYKTGRASSQKDVHENLQLTIYALACRETLQLGTPEKVTLYYTELGQRMSTVRTDPELDAARDQLIARVRPIREGNFQATPGSACRWCDYKALCPERM
jgi:DNA helicase-2/ATP-dependent DNA helicase PcrA